MSRSRIGWSAICILTALVAGGCGDEAGFTYYRARNQTNSDLVVQFSRSVGEAGTYSYVIPANGDLKIILQQGPTWRGDVAVVTADCDVVWAQHGVDVSFTTPATILIAADSAVVLSVPTKDDHDREYAQWPTATAKPTKQCVRR